MPTSKTKTKPLAPDVLLDARVVPIAHVLPNGWNVNQMNDRMYQATRESIRQGGFVDPVTVRPHPTKPDRFEIIDGEHRWKAAKDEGMKDISINVIDVPDDAVAKRLSLILNQHGTPDKLALARLVRDLKAALGERLGDGLAMTADELEELVSLAAASWEQYDTPPPPTDDEFITISFKVPKAAEHVIEEAIAKAADSGESHDRGVALERICADYLGGA